MWILIVYPNTVTTEIRVRLHLRSTYAGANNRLDIESIVTFDRDTGSEASLDPVEEPEHGFADRREHSKGKCPCVFVPWEQVQTSVLNLPVKEMDFYMPG